ncbi:hypothetical protein Y032_0335g2865 [Ancylostoma ceylanicum]|uniref:Uncharacterized protein n=1 Tax=Ancylostoma ceylanicum TaxID=53326 RepID=A0A016RYI6_9BILA|nr:hypothetical protein Y032_0335g2865 [Ancylostoma ceylanicum]
MWGCSAERRVERRRGSACWLWLSASTSMENMSAMPQQTARPSMQSSCVSAQERRTAVPPPVGVWRLLYVCRPRLGTLLLLAKSIL